MKKKWLSMLMVLCLAMAGCGASQDEEASQESEAPAQEQEETAEASDTETTDTEVTADAEGVQTVQLSTGTYYDYFYSEEYSTMLATISYPAIKLGEEDSETYPELAAGMAAYNQKLQEESESTFSEMKEEAQSAYAEGMDLAAFELNEEIVVRRADSNAVSLLISGYYYGGGAHGSSYYECVNIDSQTGAELGLSDVVTDVSLLPDLLMEQMEKYEDTSQFYTDLTEYFNTYPDTITWTLDYHGITFYFDPYELAPYAYGPVYATISFAEHPEVFAEKYQEVPESYTIELITYDPFYYDSDNDGTLDQLRISNIWTEYMFEQHSITINGMEYTEDIYGYEMSPMLVHAADGTNYLYIQNTADSDDNSLVIYRLQNNAVELVDVLYMGWCTQYVEAENIMWKHVMTDTRSFELDTPTDMLSTISGCKQYYMDETGIPMSEDPYYTFKTDRYLTLIQELVVSVVDEATNTVTGEMILPAGTQVLYYHTDDLTFADLKLDDGTVVRVEMEGDGWPKTIQGMNIEDLFEGMMFAG